MQSTLGTGQHSNIATKGLGDPGSHTKTQTENSLRSLAFREALLIYSRSSSSKDRLWILSSKDKKWNQTTNQGGLGKYQALGSGKGILRENY